MNSNIFRENDIRGIVGTDLTDESVGMLARGIGTYFRQNRVKTVALARDSRESSPAFFDIFVRQLNLTGLNVLDLGMIPTPLLYFSLFTEDVDAGVMITGSHNPSEFNGFKICLGKSSISGPEILQIRDIVDSGEFFDGHGTRCRKNVIDPYVDFVGKDIRPGPRKLKIVVDAGNGVAGIAAGPLFRHLGFETLDMFIEPQPSFANHHPDPTVPANLTDAIEKLLEEKADLAIAFDGDGDRIGVVDEKGNIIDSDRLMIVFSRAILEENPGATIIAEVKCSQQVFDEIENRGGNAIMWKVGHSLIKEKMSETGAVLAGEMSGHIFFADRYFGFDDAIYSAARLLELLSTGSKTLSELLSDLPVLARTPEIRLECGDDLKFSLVEAVKTSFEKTNRIIDIDGARILFDHGWGLVRASNTEPVIVMRFEAKDQDSLDQIRNSVETKLLDLLKKSTSQ